MALTPLGPAVATASVTAISAMILGFYKTTQTPRQCSCLRRRPKPRGIAQQGMQVRRRAEALTPLGPIVATASVIATSAMILGFCKTTRTPRQCSCFSRRPKLCGIARRDMQVRRSAVALTPLGPAVAEVSVTATTAIEATDAADLS